MLSQTIVRPAMLRFLPIATGVTIACAITAAVVQQSIRTAANEPQVAMAHDAAAALDGGATPDSVLPARGVELAVSLSPFVLVYAPDGALRASSARLHDQPPDIPGGVLDAARRARENRVTWQPEPGIRSALVAIPWSGGVVVAGRSLAEPEARTGELYRLIGTGWILGLLAVAAVCLLVEWAASRNRQPH